MASGGNKKNTNCAMSKIEGLQNFGSQVIHAYDYKSGKNFQGKNVLVVGYGYFNMEVSLDHCNHDAKPSMFVPNSVYFRHLYCQTFSGWSKIT